MGWPSAEERNRARLSYRRYSTSKLKGFIFVFATVLLIFLAEMIIGIAPSTLVFILNSFVAVFVFTVASFAYIFKRFNIGIFDTSHKNPGKEIDLPDNAYYRFLEWFFR